MVLILKNMDNYINQKGEWMNKISKNKIIKIKINQNNILFHYTEFLKRYYKKKSRIIWENTQNMYIG